MGADRFHVSRTSFKAAVEPQDLPSSMREDYSRLHSLSPAHLEASLRPGCSHMTATCISLVHFQAIEGNLNLRSAQQTVRDRKGGRGTRLWTQGLGSGAGQAEACAGGSCRGGGQWQRGLGPVRPAAADLPVGVPAALRHCHWLLVGRQLPGAAAATAEGRRLRSPARSGAGGGGDTTGEEMALQAAGQLQRCLPGG